MKGLGYTLAKAFSLWGIMMEFKQVTLGAKKSIALIAHDNKKQDMVAWCQEHKAELSNHKLYATGTTGMLIEKEAGLQITKLISGPLGGDQQVGSLISEGAVDVFSVVPGLVGVQSVLDASASLTVLPNTLKLSMSSRAVVSVD